MSRIFPVRRLGERYQELLLRPHLDDYELFSALESAYLVEGVAFSGDSGSDRPTHYREMWGESQGEPLEDIQGAMRSYCLRHKIRYYVSPLNLPRGSRQEDHYDPDDFGP